MVKDQKPLLAQLQTGYQQESPAPAFPASASEKAEAQMRKALGLAGEASQQGPSREELSTHNSTNAIGPQRRRFVQDGDVPVTVLRRESTPRYSSHHVPSSADLPTGGELQRKEALLAKETLARERAQRLLSDTHAMLRSLQTKIGHAELAKSEAVEALRLERGATRPVQAEVEAGLAKLREIRQRIQTAEEHAAALQSQLADERRARRVTEAALARAQATASRSELSPWSQARRRDQRHPWSVGEKVDRLAAASKPPSTPKPVKWWLSVKPVKKRP